MRALLVVLAVVVASPAWAYCPEPTVRLSPNDRLLDEINYLICLNNEQADLINRLSRQINGPGGLVDVANANAQTIQLLSLRIDELTARIGALEKIQTLR